MAREHLGLFDTPPDRTQVRFSLVIVGLLVVALLLVLPVRDVRLGEVHAFVPMINAVMFVGELIIATLLFAQATVFRSRALTVLGSGYVFTALLLIPHALTFPGAFAPDGLLGAGLNSPSWIAMSRRTAYAISVILYVVLKRADAVAPPETERPAVRPLIGIVSAIILAAAVTALATAGHDLLPPFYVNRSDVIYTYGAGYELVMFALFLVATTVLFRTRDSVLDMWLLVAFSGWLIQSLLIVTLQGRFTVGWYWLYGLMLTSHLVMLLSLIAESNRLYARLALSTAVRNRERETRLMSIDAVAAAISHEVGQPLTAVSTHATAGLNWLKRPKPNREMAIKSLQATIDAGLRTNEVVKSIRASFAKAPEGSTELSLNDLARTTVGLLRRELAGERVSVRFDLDEALPPVFADRVQLQRVLLNLLTNAIEALSATQKRHRRITIRTTTLDIHDVLLEVTDNGVGIAPQEMDDLFEAFFTTKATGTGLGLSLCQTIVGAHGGRLWASQGQEHGATFHLQLPRSIFSEHAAATDAANDRSSGSGTSAQGR